MLLAPKDRPYRFRFPKASDSVDLENHCGRPFSRQYVTREIARAAKRVLGRHITAQDLRHSRATDLFQKTRRLKGVSKMLGHASIVTTAKFYVRDSLTDDELFSGERL